MNKMYIIMAAISISIISLTVQCFEKTPLKSLPGTVNTISPMGKLPMYFLPETSVCAVAENFNNDSEYVLTRADKGFDAASKRVGVERCTDIFINTLPLMSAAEYGSADLVQNILKYRSEKQTTPVDVNRKSEIFGKTALMRAAATCTKNASAPTIASMLLAAGADSNIRDSRGQTAYDTVEELISAFGEENLPLKSRASCSLVKELVRPRTEATTSPA